MTARALRKEFGDHVAVDDVDLVVPAGVVLGIVGPSGCGKTTLMRLITGISRPTSGELEVFGVEPTKLTSTMRRRFGYMPQLPVLFPNLTLWGNLTFAASVYGMPLRGQRKRLKELLDFVDLSAHRNKLLAHCSGGMQRRLTLAATMVHDPELLVMDEPTAGVDPILRARFWEKFRELRDQGKTLLVPTQYVGEAANCDLVAIMSSGRLLTMVAPADMSRFAFDGDPMLVAFDGRLAGADVARLRDAPFVSSARWVDDGLLVVLEDAERDRDHLNAMLTSIGIDSTVAPYDASYDDMFVSIIERDRAAHADAPSELAA